MKVETLFFNQEREREKERNSNSLDEVNDYRIGKERDRDRERDGERERKERRIMKPRSIALSLACLRRTTILRVKRIVNGNT